MGYKLNYYEGKLVDLVEQAAKTHLNKIAYEFMGAKCTYKKFMKDIDECAASLIALGVKEDDIVCISMPNTPQAITFFYAVNKIGAVCNMIHPLSSEGEMKGFLNKVQAKTLLLMDQFYPNIKNIRDDTPVENVIVARIKDALPCFMKPLYSLTAGRKIKKIEKTEKIIWWNDFMKFGKGLSVEGAKDRNDKMAVILHSGGTTGKIKGVCLSNKAVNACSYQMKACCPMMDDTDKMLTVMPIFHGNGLVIGVHTMLITGARCVLIPRFTPASYAKDLLKHKCNYMSGVPVLFQKLIELDFMQKADLSFLKGVFAGADSLSIELEERINNFLESHNCKVRVRQGYGMTEGVVASTLNPMDVQKAGSIGPALEDVDMKIVKPGTEDEVPTGETGEIVFSSITNMMGYYNDQEETDNTLRLHKDGKLWIHTGDLASKDSDGFFFFKGRIKRMIITNGYNVFPMELENIIEGFPMVDRCCVVGIPDKERQEKVKAYIVLKPGYIGDDEMKKQLRELCLTGIARYAIPREFEFLAELPKTKVGKVDYTKLIK